MEDVADIQEQRSYAGIATSPNASSQIPSAIPVPPPPPPPLNASEPPHEDPKFVAAFDDAVIEGKLKPFVELTRDFAGDSVKEQVGIQSEVDYISPKP
jgi:adenylyl cyclase-associated protein